MEDVTLKTPDGSIANIPAYSGTQVIEINNNTPFFVDSDFTTAPYMKLSQLDSFGRCGTAMMCANSSLLPKEKRGSMATRPTGWHQNKYEFLKNDDNPAGYFMCRAHLLPYCLTGILDEEKNLISSTFSMNGYSGMETYEMEILSYIKKNPENHVMYRVTPVFKGNNLFSNGVLMEAESVEDNGICFCIFVYNAENGVVIDYETGENWAS